MRSWGRWQKVMCALPIIIENEAKKKQFAEELARHTNRDDPSVHYQAALAVIGDDAGLALVASSKWPKDSIVINHLRELDAKFGEMHFLPTKADLAKQVWAIGANDKMSVDDRLKALRLYGEIRDFITKGPAVVNNNMVSNKVMLVQDFENADVWEQQASAQQAKLIEDANRPVQ